MIGSANVFDIGKLFWTSQPCSHESVYMDAHYMTTNLLWSS